MEKAIHITRLDNLKFYNSRFNRIYFGVEFCQNLIPSLSAVNKILRFIKANTRQISLVTPFVTDVGLSKLISIFRYLKNNVINCEIIVNDWGVLEVLSNKFRNNFRISLGRLLIHQQRDPAIIKVIYKQKTRAILGEDKNIRIFVHKPPNKIYREGMSSSYVNSPSMQNLLTEFGIERIELNNLIQGINLENLTLKKSLYTPFVNISTTRFCPMETRYQKIFRINVCKRECQNFYDRLYNHSIPKIIYKRGNTLFYKNPLRIRDALNLGIDRIVFQPELPF